MTSDTTFEIKQGDSLPALRIQLLNDVDASIYVLSGNETVNFKMRDMDGNEVTLNGTSSIYSAVDGIVEYSFDSADTSEPGFFEGEFEIEDTSSNKLTIPGDRSLYVHVFDDVS